MMQTNRTVVGTVTVAALVAVAMAGGCGSDDAAPEASTSVPAPAASTTMGVTPATAVPVGASTLQTGRDGRPVQVLRMADGTVTGLKATCGPGDAAIVRPRPGFELVCPADNTVYDAISGQKKSGPGADHLDHVAVTMGGDQRISVGVSSSPATPVPPVPPNPVPPGGH